MKIIFTLLLLALPVSAELIPAARLYNWQAGVTVGVPGGFTQFTAGGASDRAVSGTVRNVTQAPYSADNTGVTDARTAIASAITAASNGDVIYLPAGTYKITSPGIDLGTKTLTLRGDGLTTIIKPTGTMTYAVQAGSQSSFSYTATTGGTVTAGLSAGSTSLTVSSGTAFTAGEMAYVIQQNEQDPTRVEAGAALNISTLGVPELRRQVVKITAKVGNVLTINPPLYDGYGGSNLAVDVRRITAKCDYPGFEDLHIDCSSATVNRGLTMHQCYGGWAYNVKVTKAGSFGININRSLFTEIRRCHVYGPGGSGPNGGGIYTITSCGHLIEDNIVEKFFPCFEINYSSSGGVVAYNFIDDSVTGGVIGGCLNTNHDPHNSYNLYEGNVCPNTQSDGYFGSESEATFFRNWLHGTAQSNSVLATIQFRPGRFARNFSLVGNVLGKTGVTSGGILYGYPNIGNTSTTGTAQPTLNDWWSGFPEAAATGTLSTRTSDQAGIVTLDAAQDSANLRNGQSQLSIRWGTSFKKINVTTTDLTNLTFTAFSGDTTVLPAAATAVTFFGGPDGFQELDLDVEASTVEKGNYLYGTSGAAGSMSSLGGDTLSDSLFRSSKPTYFASLSWPPFSPTSPNSADYADIPAGYRWVYGVDPPATAYDATYQPKTRAAKMKAPK